MLLNDLVIIFTLSVAVLFVSHRFRLPAIVGLFITGILAGPHGLGLISAVEEVETMAEIGVVLLLFTIGIEFSFQRLMQIKRSILVGGSIQVVLTIVVTTALAIRLGQPTGQAVFIGFLVSLSSTAIVLRIIQERAEVDSPHGRTSLAILIFQDIIIVAMILAVPVLAGETTDVGLSILLMLAKGAAIIGVVFISAKYVVPQVLFQMARTQSRELFLLTIILICLGVAWMTANAGLSLALGAFLAGLVISESEYSHQALGNILPFRDVFTSFFFISTGMLLNISVLLDRPGEFALLLLGLLALKSLIAGSAAMLLGLPLRAAILVGLSLSQIGEFSFILSKVGLDHGLLDSAVFQTFLTVSVLSMALTPFIIARGPRWADALLRLPWPRRLAAGTFTVPEPKSEDLKHHLVIVGFGVTGRNVARAARAARIPYGIIEMNPEIVRDEQARDEPIHYGDATQEAVLERVKIDSARIIVIVINDPTTTRRIAATVRRLNPTGHIIVRTRYLHEVKPLHNLGANEVIPEEFETSIEIFTRVLTNYLVPREDIEKLVSEVRSDGYEMFRRLSAEATIISGHQLHLPNVEIVALRIAPDSALAGKNLAELRLRKQYQVTVLAIRRDSEIISNPTIDIPFEVNDVLFVLGTPEKIAEAADLFG